MNVNSGPFVRQAQDFSDPDPDTVYTEPETYDEYYALIDAFVSGAKLWTFVPNVQDCSYYSHIFLNDYNTTKVMIENY